MLQQLAPLRTVTSLARWLDAVWEHADLDMVPRADRLFGPYRQYEPDLVTSRPLSMSPEANRVATVAERAVRELATGPGAPALEGLARFLLRSEAIASSLIEGIAPSPQQVALAELAEHRAGQGRRETPRADSATSRILRTLPATPILTTRTAQRRLGVSFPAARAALEELADAGILARRSVERGTTGYTATDVFSLVTHAERPLASTRWDTRISVPNRPVPALPHD